MTTITSHVLDTSLGLPAEGLAIKLEYQIHDSWELAGISVTNSQGRVEGFAVGEVNARHFRLTFSVGDYFSRRNLTAFFPDIMVNFLVDRGQPHYHIPLLITPFGYSTYRGS